MNKAYRILSSPIQRGLYLLELANVNYGKKTVNTHETDSERSRILMDILELNEKIDDIKEAYEVENLEKRLEIIMKPFEKELESAFEKNEFEKAVEIVSKMKYYKNIDERLKDLKLKFNLTNE